MWLPTDEGRLLSSLVDNRHPMSTMSCIDAVGKATKGLFDTNEKQYHSQVFEEPLEITSLLGASPERKASRICTCTSTWAMPTMTCTAAT